MQRLGTVASGMCSHPSAQRPALHTFPSKTDGVEIELPDFDDLFGRIQQVSPLARVAIEGGEISNGKRGFAAVDNTCKLTIRISGILLGNHWRPY